MVRAFKLLLPYGECYRTAGQGMLGRLQCLPGFGCRVLINAMMSAENQRFPCWERPGD